MDRQVRRKLAMATSVRTFSRAHPSPDASYTLVLDRLDGTISRIEELAKQQEGGYVSKHSASVRRADLRRRLQIGLLRHVVTAAEDVGSEAPAVAEKFGIPNSNATHTAFRTSASEMLDLARANQDLLVKHGLSATLLDGLDAAIKEFDASLQETDDGKQSHVAARAEMKTLSDEIMRLVGMLDGFNRYRFHLDPELIVSWESAKHVVTGPQPKETEPTAPAPAAIEKPAA
jgi:hypothetical protein